MVATVNRTAGACKTFIGIDLKVERFQVVRAKYFGQSVDRRHIDAVWVILTETGGQQFFRVCVVDADVARGQKGIFGSLANDSWFECFDVLFGAKLFQQFEWMLDLPQIVDVDLIELGAYEIPHEIVWSIEIAIGLRFGQCTNDCVQRNGQSLFGWRIFLHMMDRVENLIRFSK